VIAFGLGKTGASNSTPGSEAGLPVFSSPPDAIIPFERHGKLSYLMISEKNRQKLMKAKSKEDLIEVLDSNE
jgi:hypothetical protein